MADERAGGASAAGDVPLWRRLLVGGAVLGAALLIVAEFTPLFTVRVAVYQQLVTSHTAGSHHAYALLLIALLSLFLAVGFWRTRSLPALAALAILGLISLLIGLLGDLPDAHTSGLVLHSGHYVTATSTPGAGMYLETLGSILLLISSVCGLLLLGPPWEPASRRLSGS